MAQNARLTSRLGQRLALTPQLTQSLKVLAMNAMELDAYIADCLQSNPLLEVDERPYESPEPAAGEAQRQTDRRETGDNRWETMGASVGGSDGEDMRDQQWPAHQTVSQSLHEQAGRQPMPDEDRLVAHALIDSLDDDGYFRTDPAALAASLHCSAAAIERVLEHIVQQLEPAGVGARNVSECLLLQLDGDDNCEALARRLLLHFPDQLFEPDDVLARRTGRSVEALAKARLRLRRLDPFPGHGPHSQESIYIRPEVIFRRNAAGEIHIEIPGYNWQGLRLNKQWQGRRWHGAEREFMDASLKNAKWLLYAMEQRQETLYKVADCLARRQGAFLEYGPLGLRPLTLQDVGGEVGLHESTISRVTSGKYAETPLGLIEMRRFFSAGLPTRGRGAISVYRVQQRIRAMIEAEPAGRPVSDQTISSRLQAEGIEIARRTVAKYREVLGLPPGSQRRRAGGRHNQHKKGDSLCKYP